MSRPPATRPGDLVAAIDTPALVIDLDAMERNIAAMARYVHAHGVRLRPHAKTHKCAEVARRQMAAGAVGICVQKLQEAQALAARGIDNIYISNQVVDPAKLARLADLGRALNQRGGQLALAVDSVVGIERLAQACASIGARVDVLVEVDVGQGRCGALPQQAGELAAHVVAAQAQGLRLAGLQAYHGTAQHIRDPLQRQAAVAQAGHAARAALASMAERGLTVPLVSGAGTGTFGLETAAGLHGELQAGSYVFLDRDYGEVLAQPAGGADVPRFEPALFIRCQVISRHAERAVVDAGHKTFAIDSGLPAVIGRPLTLGNGGDEHGVLRPVEGVSGPADLPALGEGVWLQPGHCDPTVNLHDHYVVVRGGLGDDARVEALWAIDARGALG